MTPARPGLFFFCLFFFFKILSIFSALVDASVDGIIGKLRLTVRGEELALMSRVTRPGICGVLARYARDTRTCSPASSLLSSAFVLSFFKSSKKKTKQKKQGRELVV